MNNNHRSVLMVAFHFPPCSGSSGLLRSLCFANDLVDQGWSPIVLSASPRAYSQTSDDLIARINSNVQVHRAPAWDTVRHFAYRGKHLRITALPDRFVSWVPAAIAIGVRHALRPEVSCIWSTYPVASAHLIGLAIARLTGKPWIADFRDPMVEYNQSSATWAPANPAVRRSRLWIEKQCVDHASALVYCTEGALRIAQERHGDAMEHKSHVIPNGYDESTFAELEKSQPILSPAINREKDAVRLIHSGIIYPTEERNPRHFIAAVAMLRKRGLLKDGRDQIIFRASGNEEWLAGIIAEFDCAKLIELMPHIPYQEAIAETLAADGLIVFQGYTANPAIPAKVYEYIRSGRPIFGVVNDAGDTARLLRSVGVTHMVDLQSAEEIEKQLAAFVTGIRNHTEQGVSAAHARQFSRSSRAVELSSLLDGCVKAKSNKNS